MNKHTPKPWKIDGQTIYGSGKNPFICHWSGTIFDAYLIAAAPELLERLESLTAWWENWMPNAALEPGGDEELEKCKKIIKKAKGDE